LGRSMRRLPPLVAGTSRYVLPMADHSAAALAEWLLADESHTAAGRLAALLAGDPPLLVWSVCVGWRNARLQPQCIADVADWLAEHLLEVLRWDEVTPMAAMATIRNGDDATSPDDGPRALRDADHVGTALKLANLAMALAAKNDPFAADQALFLGSVDNARGWFTAVGDSDEDTLAVLVPTWLRKLQEKETQQASPDCSVDALNNLRPEALAAVRLARGGLHGGVSPSEMFKADLMAAGRHAEEGRRRWLATTDGLAAWLPQVAAKLGRLSKLEQTFDETLEAEKLEAMAEFAAGAGHEINNPLTVIAGRAQLFLHEETDPERRRALALMNAQAMRVYEMIADMMLFARPPQPEFQPVELVNLVDNVIADLLPRATRQETAMCRTGESGPILVNADPVQLNVALRAICQNSLEALSSGGHVEIDVAMEMVAENGSGVIASMDEVALDGGKTRPPPRFVAVVRIHDDGPGIKNEERRHIFDPFYSARQAGRGLGLGLSKAWRIITNHGGRIDVASPQAHGTTFIITLPRQNAKPADRVQE
jgi:signal transduction histidine kinase